jgi:hypothetical protein
MGASRLSTSFQLPSDNWHSQTITGISSRLHCASWQAEQRLSAYRRQLGVCALVLSLMPVETVQ